MSDIEVWKYTLEAMYPSIQDKDILINSGQFETRYTHVTGVEVNHYRLVTSWISSHDKTSALVTAILYRRDDGNEYSRYVVVHHEVIEQDYYRVRQYVAKLHGELVQKHLGM